MVIERTGSGVGEGTGPAGDTDDMTQALDGLFRDRFVPMVRLATLLTGSQHEAEEIVMDAFVRLAARPHGIGDLDEPAAYLRTSVVNGAHSRHRRLRTIRSTPTYRPSPHTDPQFDDLWQRLGSLNDDQRRCVVLRFYEDLTLNQIAAVLGMPLGTVKSHLHRAIRKLRPLLRHDDGEQDTSDGPPDEIDRNGADL